MSDDYYLALKQELSAIEERAWSVLREKYDDDVIKGALGGWGEIEIIAPRDNRYSPYKYALILLQSVNDVRQAVTKQNNLDAKIAVMEAARAGFDVGLHYLGMNDERIGKIVDDFKSIQTSEAAKARHAYKEKAKERAQQLAREHWQNPEKKNRLSLNATTEDVFKRLVEEKVWYERCGWSENAVKEWIKELPERPPQKAGRKPKTN